MDANASTMSQEGKKSPFDDLSKDELITKCKGLLVIAQKAKLSKSELQAEIESYKIQVEKYETEKKSNIKNLQILQELVDSLTEQKLNYITEVDSAQTKIKALQAQCITYEEAINNFKTDLIIRDKKIADVTQALSDVDSEVISLKRQNKRLVDENEQLISQLAELETRAAEFNNIGLEQRRQLQILEEAVQSGTCDKNYIEELENKVKELENKVASVVIISEDDKKYENYEKKIEELTQLYETEKNKKDKLNIKLKSYKDKILKCAACINQLKNTRFILTKTLREYSENIPKWQHDILTASKVLDDQIKDLNNENTTLKDKIQVLEQQLKDVLGAQQHMTEEIQRSQSNVNSELITENSKLKEVVFNLEQQLRDVLGDNNTLPEKLAEIKCKYHELDEIMLPAQIKANQLLKDQMMEQAQKVHDLTERNAALVMSISELEAKTLEMEKSLLNKMDHKEAMENLNLQIKALESEKSSLVKEKLNARDHNVELEHQNKILSDQVVRMRSDAQTLKHQYDHLLQEKTVMENKHKSAKESEVSTLKCEVITLQDKYDMLMKEHENLQDLNGLLKEEVETLKLSLEQPNDDSEHMSDLNVSMQADVVKLETKLAAYKQENSSLLTEVKESRNKVKEFDSLIAEYEETKSKMLGYKTENSELLNEMKEINQVLKERGNSISKLQKAIGEMERLIETLEKDRDESIKEKDNLLNRIGALEKELKNAKQKTIRDTDENDQLIAERDKAINMLQEKDGLIASLKEDIEKLKQHPTTSDLPNEDMSTSTISKAEEHARMKDLDETFEEKYTKLRIFALKLKKKLNETTTLLQNTEQDKAKLEKILSENTAASSQLASAAEDEVDSKSPIEDNTKITELQAKVTSLIIDVETAQHTTAELERVKAELESKSHLLTSEIEAHKATKESLEKARRDIKKKNVLSLEMEDYERSMKELTTKMEENKRKIVQMESTIDTQEATITAMRTQIKLLEEQVKSEESQNRLIREELQHAIDEGNEKDNVILTKNAFITKLEQDLEDEKRKNEEADLEMTSLLGDKEKIIMGLGEDKAELNNKVKRLEFKCGELNENLRIVNIELADLKTEYTSYKVRAQAVLRQNQTVDHSHEERLKEEAAALKAQIETLTAKLVTAQELCSEQSSDAEAARRRAAEATSEATRAQQRTARLQADLTRLGQQLETERTQHKLQVSTLSQCYKTQISDLESKLQKETELLKKQLAAAQESSSQIREPNVEVNSNRNQYMVATIPKDEGSDGELDINVSMIPREEGEGSESAPSPPPSKPYSSGGRARSPVPLDRLLEEGVPEDEALDTASLALTPEQEVAELKRRLQAQQQRVAHITVLLAESEREAARRAQLADLLKAELRRLRATASHAHNTEYMKNVTLKFLTLPPGDERGRLVPVLQKILTLTPDEMNKIQAVAKGLDPNPSKSWGSYLPWPGGK